MQHISYEAQVEVKEGIVRDALERIGGIELVDPIDRFVAPAPFGSRSRIELHTDAESGAVGFFARRSKQIVDVEQCMVCRPALQAAITTIRKSKPPRPEAIHLLDVSGVVHSAPRVPPMEGGSSWLTIGSLDYFVHPAGFFQASLDLVPAMIERVVKSSTRERGLAWDLFSSIGLFALPLAQDYRQVVGVEFDGRSASNAVRGAERNEIANVRFASADVNAWLGHKRHRHVVPDLVVVDPPRVGLGTELATRLRDRQLTSLTYVSCDPTTLARDLKILLAGNLRIQDVAIFDLFPQTHHVETVVRLVDPAAS